MKRNKRLILIVVLFFVQVVSVVSADTLVLTVEQAVELALKNNYQLKQNEEKVQEAAAGKGVAFGNFLPQVSLSGSYTRLGTVNQFEMVAPVYKMLPLRVYDPISGQIIGFTDSVPLPVGADTVRMALGSQNNYLLRGTVQQTLFTWGKLINAYQIAGLSLEAPQPGQRASTKRPLTE